MGKGGLCGWELYLFNSSNKIGRFIKITSFVSWRLQGMKTNSRRQFIKTSLLAGGGLLAFPFLARNVRAQANQESRQLLGVCYGPFRENQSPEQGIFPSEDEIKEDLSILSGFTSNIRTYGNDEILYEIPRLCNEAGINCYPGAWISGNESANDQSIENLIKIANQSYNTTKGLIVGSEVLFRRDISEEKLIEYITQVNLATDIPVTTAETWSEWLNHPNLAEAVDNILIHVHPYWEGISIYDAVGHVIEKWNKIKEDYPGKEVIIGEAGWPTAGNIIGNAVPSEENQRKFLTEFRSLAEKNNAKYFFFDAFDEAWKGADEGAVGRHWGLLYADRTPKPGLEPDLEDILTGMISKIVFTEYNADEPIGSKIDLWIANSDGSGLKRLFDGIHDTYNKVRFSPDGKFITFKGTDDKHRIMDLEGDVLHEFGGGSRSGRDLTWTPDGNSLLFGVYTHGIYRYNLGNSTLEKIHDTKGFTYDHNPMMSPNLEKIVFTHHEYGSHYYIYTMDADGKNEELITNGTGTKHDEQLSLDWLDNKNIIFKIAGKGKLYHFNTETKEGKEIDLAGDIRLSPDKKTLAVFGGSKLYFVNTSELLSGSVTPSIKDLGTYTSSFAWSKDGKYFVVDDRSGLRIFDRDSNEYKFLTKEDFPEKFGYIKSIDWSSGLIRVGTRIIPTIEPPSNLVVSDIPNDHGHRLRLTWTKSPSEYEGLVDYYNIFRSRSSNGIETIKDISEFNSLDLLNAWEGNNAILRETVSAGIEEYIDEAVPLNNVPYHYWLQAVYGNLQSEKIAGNREDITTLVNENKPDQFTLFQNHPNPFNLNTTVKYYLPEMTDVRLDIYNSIGQKVRTLVNEKQAPGTYSLQWGGEKDDGLNATSGIYLYRLITSGFVETKRMVLVK